MKNILTFFLTIIFLCCVVNGLAGCSNVSIPIELKDHINEPMSSIQSVVKDMSDSGFKGGNNYGNGAVSEYADFDVDEIKSITISNQCNYSLYGITIGIDMEKADSLAWQSCTQRTEDRDHSKSYIMEDGSYLYLQSDNDDNISWIEVTNYDKNPADDEDDSDGSYTDDYSEDAPFDYDEPGDYSYVYDLNNIGFLDMMFYTDWCKLSKIHYKNGEGYVDIDPDRNGKYSFVNGYCMIYYFNTDKMDYNESYRRIFRCDVVDNDNAVLVPQDSGNYIKKNMQILERSVFHNDEYVYMTINDGDSKGPFIPYEFVDWTSGEKTTNDSGKTVYRFNIK